MFANKIKTQLMLIALLPLLSVIVLIASFIFYQSKINLEQELNERGQLITAQAALMSDFYLYTGNISKLEEVAEILQKVDGLVFIRFFDNAGNTLVERGNTNSKSNVEPFYTVVTNSHTQIDDFADTNSINQQPEALGSILLGLSRHALTTKQQQGYYLVLMVSALSLIIGIVLIYLFSKRFNVAMSSLLNAANVIQQGQYDGRCIENGSGELLIFQQTFNKMIESLQRNEYELQAKITEATQSINETVQELANKNDELEKTKQEALRLERSKAIADERSRIMRDMHDGIGGQLVASLALIELEPDNEVTKNITSILSDCLDDFRLIINSLNIQSNTLPALLADFKYRINRKLDKMGINLTWELKDIPDNVVIEPQQSLHILRILQEAFTNILKHANASKIHISAHNIGGKIHIEIKDNGRNTSQNDAKAGHGISNMKWRANELSGELEVKQEASNGYKVTLIIPMEISV